MPMTNPREVFIHDLSDMLSAEQIILSTLPTMQSDAQNHELKQALQEHERETQQQIQNIEKVFQMIGAKPEKITCHGAEGLKKEYESAKQQKPPAQMLELEVIGAESRTEHLEIAHYTSLAQMAMFLGETQAQQLLLQNLAQEMTMSSRVEALSEKIGKQVFKSSASMTTKTAPAATTGTVPVEPGQEVIVEA